MAVGKSAIGAELAAALGLAFVDSDALVVAKHGPIPEIFASRGERHFRQLEAKAIAGVLDPESGAPAKPRVLSLGGGAVLDSGTQQLLARATVVHLDADLETVRDRITRNTGRPLLAEDPLSRWQELAAVRTPVYERLADITLDVRHGTVPELVAALATALNTHPHHQIGPS
ncbi:shikimate kinase [Arthrobacter sp. 35W]|uniref:shikimate kinase n=1 Tax=Arthrobacter sp. 35W TaxID=1132441 RepID=UPI0009DEDE97|nr:shikimate kinase [Arthrobacter sp. 35W]